jgi:hypothetical protein
MNIIPIVPATLDIIEVLNGGVRPDIEVEETFFIFNDKDEPSDIVTAGVLRERYDTTWMSMTLISYKG